MTLTIIEVDRKRNILWARRIDSPGFLTNTSSGELVLPGLPTAAEIIEAANNQLVVPSEVGYYSKYEIRWVD